MFFAGLMFTAYAAIVALILTQAINDTTALILMIAPIGLVIPMLKAANRQADAGVANCIGKGQAKRNYVKRVAIFTALYMIAIGLMTFVLKDGEPSAALRAILATLPGLAIIGIFWAIGRLIVEEQDEFMKMLVVRQTLVATGLSMSAASVWGFLESADVVIHADAYWWAIVWFFGLGVGAVINRIQYGTWGAV
ncbi:MAG: hypothetical protein WAT93_07040 [Pontixanthobacter sp.]